MSSPFFEKLSCCVAHLLSKGPSQGLFKSVIGCLGFLARGYSFVDERVTDCHSVLVHLATGELFIGL